MRITQPKDDEYHPTVELIEKDSGKLILMLHDGSDADLFDPSECVWYGRLTPSDWLMGFVPIRRGRG